MKDVSKLEAMVYAYENVRRRTLEGTLAEAIMNHSQACGLVAFVFNTHPDTVALAVKESTIRARS